MCVEVTDVVFAFATCSNIDHVVKIAFDMVMNIATEFHLIIARLFVGGGSLHTTSTSAAGE